jgi:exopolyphosphatase/guanosine-5'-triphosphate,3'-diphosphate pyrophosphatase
VPRAGAVDIGTNSTRLLIADVHDGAVTAIVRRAKVTRLGEGVDAARRLLPDAVARVHRVLADYLDELTEHAVERVIAVGTSAVRDAADGSAFLQGVEAEFGFETRLLSGAEEAELTRVGVGAKDDSTLILDVGGGSTELIAGPFQTSLDVGSVRLAERFPASLDDAAAFVDALLPDLDVQSAIGVGGTIAQLHALAGELSLAAVERELDRLAALPLEERRRVPGLDPDRAPVIVTGALIVRQVLRLRAGAARVQRARSARRRPAHTMFRFRHLA